MWKTELGGSVHTVQHLYHWSDYDQRDRVRAAAEASTEWFAPDGLRGWVPEEMAPAASAANQDDTPMVLPLPSLRQKLQSAESVVMLEATDCLQSCGLPGAADFEPTQANAAVAWELRRYQLALGYPTVPRFLELYAEGLQDKLAADDSG
eukprot:5251230-Prymnesium_polylepis.1